MCRPDGVCASACTRHCLYCDDTRAVYNDTPLSPRAYCSALSQVLEGYGQTECVAPCTLTLQGDARPDHVGPPLPCCDIKLIDVPEMNYFAASGQGEVCIRGTNVTQVRQSEG